MPEPKQPATVLIAIPNTSTPGYPSATSYQLPRTPTAPNFSTQVLALSGDESPPYLSYTSAIHRYLCR